MIASAANDPEWREGFQDTLAQQKAQITNQDAELGVLRRQVRKANARAKKLETQEQSRQQALQQLIKQDKSK